MPLIKQTQTRIAKEIADLQAMKPKVKPTSAFGDNHHNAIDAQIRVLSGDIPVEDFDEEFEDAESNVVDAAQGALDWMDGTIQENPAESWKDLLIG